MRTLCPVVCMVFLAARGAAHLSLVLDRRAEWGRVAPQGCPGGTAAKAARLQTGALQERLHLASRDRALLPTPVPARTRTPSAQPVFH
jgi:hypothetical protein